MPKKFTTNDFPIDILMLMPTLLDKTVTVWSASIATTAAMVNTTGEEYHSGCTVDGDETKYLFSHYTFYHIEVNWRQKFELTFLLKNSALTFCHHMNPIW